jgi:hypothetical protein
VLGRGERVTVDEFIEKWRVSGGNERANTQLFVNDLCALLGASSPQPTQTDMAANDYVFERHVVKTEIDGTTSNGWIDCYKRDCFILEAKQGSDKDREAVDAGHGDSLRDFFGQTAAERFKRGMAKRGTGQWTAAMQKAAGQAEGYAKALPTKHGWPPFLLVSDIGYCIDIYADFSRSGKGYAPFPDRRRYRIELDDLRDAKVRDRLKSICSNPMSLDPSAEAARVTREVADHLATVARRLEAREQNPDRVAHFLMRLLFTMFAEDTGLIPKASFSKLLKKVRDRPENLVPQLQELWSRMDTGGFVGALGEAGETVRQFNGYLFKETVALTLDQEEIDVLIEAAKAKWNHVEPAIFGTLLERALNPKERAKLGAHYTPRAYVERLVEPTIMEPLKDDWVGAWTAAMEAAELGDKDNAREIVEAFHGKLTRTKVLDPACGTGNFLYVAMARMKELEGEVLELLEELGDRQYLAEISGHTITPENFLGLEINPRAAAIAQLVLWIGYLQWHFKVNGEDRMPEPPVLRDVKTIECRDALIEWDRKELERDKRGQPVTRWDGESMKRHPVTGKPVPDETVRVEVFRYINPRAAKWPKADFIIGNPPFIGKGKRARDYLGRSYLDALKRVSKVKLSADYVMHWWNRAAMRVRKGATRRFGFIAPNTITQIFNTRVIKSHFDALEPFSIVYAIPDHPWIDEKGSAAIRISMTVGERSSHEGTLLQVTDESGAPDRIEFESTQGTVSPTLVTKLDAKSAKPLKSNDKLASPGIKTFGEGFVISGEQQSKWASSLPIGEMKFVFPYFSGKDVTDRWRGKYVIDLDHLSERKAEELAPSLYDWVLHRVKPQRETNDDPVRKADWWRFGRRNTELRSAIADLDRFIVTTETAKHRMFQFLLKGDFPEGGLVVIGLGDAYFLGVLSSRIHRVWMQRCKGVLETRPRYNKTRCFDPFPFPDTADDALKQRIRETAEKLDALRKQVLERHPDLTLTKLYNALEALRAADSFGGVLKEKERDIVERGCVSLIRQYHHEIDVAVGEAYGWPANLSDEQVLERLVALNKERAAEEAKGKVRWLRPKFQAPGYVAPAEQQALALPEQEKAVEVLEWPSKLPEQVVAVSAVVERAGRPIAANDVARAFKGKRAGTVVPVLDALSGMGRLRKLEDGRYAA